METTPTWMPYAGVALAGAVLGLVGGCFFEALDNWMRKLRLLTAALGGALAAVAYYFVIPDPWSFFRVIFFIATSVIGGCVGWDRGPRKQTAEEQRKEHLERWRKFCEKEGRM